MYSASEIIADMVQKSKLPDLEHDKCPSKMEQRAPEENFIEQLLEVPDTLKRREFECKEHFIRSILDVQEEELEPLIPDKETEELQCTPMCSAPKKVLGGIQAMLGFFLLVVQIISVELLGPVILNANQLIQTLLEAMPSSEKSYDLVLPFFGVSSGRVTVASIRREDNTMSHQFTR